MLLEAFKANTDAGYVIVPVIVPHNGYISYNFTGMTASEVRAWQIACALPQVRRAHPATADGYLSLIQNLGIRAALSGSDAAHALRAEYHSKPLSRRIK